MTSRFALLTALVLLVPLHVASAGEARIGGAALKLPADVIGYQSSSSKSSVHAEGGELEAVGAVGHVRYPEASFANVWNWRTGTIIRELTHHVDSELLPGEPWRPTDVVAEIAEGSEILYVMNIANPTPITGLGIADGRAAPDSLAILDAKIDDTLDALGAFEKAGKAVSRVVIGADFSSDFVPGIYTGNVQRYIRHANRVAQSIKGFDVGIEVAVVLESSRGAQEPTDWSTAVYEALALGRLRNVDAVSFERAPRTWLPAGLDSLDAAELTLARAHRHVSGPVAQDLAQVPSGLAVWSDEHFGEVVSLKGTWVEALNKVIVATRTLAQDSRIDSLNLSRGADPLEAEGVAGEDLAMEVLLRALEGRGELRSLRFDGVAQAAIVDGAPGVSGVRLSGYAGEAVVLINATQDPVENLQVSGLLPRGVRHRAEQHSDSTPLTRAPDGGPVRSGMGGGLESREWDLPGHTIDLKPFSIAAVWSVSTSGE